MSFKPRSELGGRDDWESPEHANRRRMKRALRSAPDSGNYQGDSNSYQRENEGSIRSGAPAGPAELPPAEGEYPAELLSGLPGDVSLERPEPLEERDSRLRMQRTCQVNVRITGWQYDALSRAADLYGLSPTEMARLFINRGARAVLRDFRREPVP